MECSRYRAGINYFPGSRVLLPGVIELLFFRAAQTHLTHTGPPAISQEGYCLVVEVWCVFGERANKLIKLLPRV